MRKILVVLCVVCTMMVGTASMAQAAAPSNDDIANATVVTGVPFTDATNNEEATGEPDAACGLAATVWYQFTPTESAFLGFSTAGSDFEAAVAVYSGTPGNLTYVGCNYSQVAANVIAGESYYVAVGTCCFNDPGQVGPGGNIVFNIQELPPPVSSITVTVDRRATVTNFGVVTMSGTVTCDQPAYAYIQPTVTQRFQRQLAQGTGYASTPCGPTATMWTAQVTSQTATIFGPGNATVSGYASASDNYTSVYTDLRGELQLRRSN
jgi:hypothetical protein